MSIMTMVVIGYDRYNVIVKGFNGVKITPCIAAGILILIYIYSIGSCIGPFFGWGGYALGKIKYFRFCYIMFITIIKSTSRGSPIDVLL